MPSSHRVLNHRWRLKRLGNAQDVPQLTALLQRLQACTPPHQAATQQSSLAVLLDRIGLVLREPLQHLQIIIQYDDDLALAKRGFPTQRILPLLLGGYMYALQSIRPNSSLQISSRITHGVLWIELRYHCDQERIQSQQYRSVSPTAIDQSTCSLMIVQEVMQLQVGSVRVWEELEGEPALIVCLSEAI
jgi:hypothetical protein